MEQLFEQNYIIVDDDARIHKSKVIDTFESLRFEDETDFKFLKRIKLFLLAKNGITWNPNLRELNGGNSKGVFIGIKRKKKIEENKSNNIINNINVDNTIKSDDAPLISLEEELPVTNKVNASDAFESIESNKEIKLDTKDSKTKFKEFEPQLWKDVSEASKTRYKSCLKKLKEEAKFNGVTFNVDDFENTLNLIDEVIGDFDYKGRERSDSQKATLRSNYVKAIIWKLKENGKYSNPLKYEFYLKLMRDNKAIYVNERSENIQNDREKEVWISWEDVIKRRDELEKIANEKKNKTAWKRCLVLSLYTLFPPRRILDYSAMVVINNVEDDKIEELDKMKNYYVKKRKLFIFKNWKEASFYKTQVFEINNKLNNIIVTYLKYMLDFEEGDSLLNSDSANLLQRMISNVMEKPGFSVNIMRKSFLSYKARTGYLNLQERKDIARAMGHSLNQQLEYEKKENN